MLILVHEFVSGGGLAGRPVPASLAREGEAMRRALVADLAATRRHRVVTTADRRYPQGPTRGVEVVTLPPRSRLLDELMAGADAVWLVAPETDGCLARLTAKAEALGKRVLGSGSVAIRRASDKAGLARRLERAGVPHPETCVLRQGRRSKLEAARLGYPLVVKPSLGAGCCGVGLARGPRELRRALEAAQDADGTGPLLLQRYIPGTAASVSLLADGRRAVALAVNAQRIKAARRFDYGGGLTPLAHPLAERAAELAVRACRSVPGLRGYVGVDLVLSAREAVVIEINPRLTTAYLGVRCALSGNLAALAIDACFGVLPKPPKLERQVRFSAAGRTAVAKLPCALRNPP